MAKTKTWQYVPNYVPTNASAANLAKNVLWFITRFMLGDQTALTFKDETGATIAGGALVGQYFVWGSCDGSGGAGSFTSGGTAGSPAGDKWTSTFDATKIVQNTTGNNHSWFVLGSVNSLGTSGQGPYYLIIDCNSATTNIVTVFLCKTAPTGASATAAPTSTDSFGPNTNPFTFLTTTTLNHHLQGILSTDGIARMFQSRDGVGSFASTFAVEVFGGALAGDLWPVALHYYLQDSPTTANWPYSIIGEGVNYSTSAPVNTNGGWRGRSADGTTITTYVPFTPAYRNSAATNMSSWGAQVDYASNPNTPTTPWDNVPFWGMIGIPGQYPGFRGILYDVGLAAARKGASPLVLGDGTFDSTNKFIVVGDSWQPAIAAPVL